MLDRDETFLPISIERFDFCSGVRQLLFSFLLRFLLLMVEIICLGLKFVAEFLLSLFLIYLGDSFHLLQLILMPDSFPLELPIEGLNLFFVGSFHLFMIVRILMTALPRNVTDVFFDFVTDLMQRIIDTDRCVFLLLRLHGAPSLNRKHRTATSDGFTPSLIVFHF